ncbi:Phosphoacetylglucosamine mutase [Favolaschia claudopus]|uniref:Phosphoacetylglucosamine mutase n=1 Tax=Favolaschia claudopus TaxID=2862362 RepID=A0AAW0C3H4_9AGAR
MPVERSRYSRRSHADGTGIVWTLPVQPVGESGIDFAPNLTESSFADLPPLVDAPYAPISPSESVIFTFDDGSAPTRRAPHTRKKSDNHIPRPPNAFILFRSSFIKSQSVSTEVETNHSTLSKIIGMTWKNLPPEERRLWHDKAMDAVEEHKRNFPAYAFRPKNPGGRKAKRDGAMPKPKRKVREVYQDSQRCKKIAELLVEGKKGAELDRAIQEFDKHHVPEIVTRFEAPITARTYRRSSSVPVPSSDDSQKFLTSVPTSTADNSRRRRSSSVGAETRASQELAEHRKQRLASLSVDTDAASTSDGQLTPPPLDSFSWQYKQEPDLESLDFSSFSFSNVTSPAPSFGCDPLMMPPSPLTSVFSPEVGATSPVDSVSLESMDISAFIANEWQLHGDNAYTPSDYSAVGIPTPSFAFHIPAYTTADPAFCSSFKNLGFQEQYPVQQPMPGLAQLEAELASFMAQHFPGDQFAHSK